MNKHHHFIKRLKISLEQEESTKLPQGKSFNQSLNSIVIVGKSN